ncbi:hypothetical protein RJT34_25643 [Clitoria ternatea]|uniref:Uncharacterized protein n=1 Tax=Clitoria ternatea TaxID=43366 RepID=A0AAN9FSG9_CLITE
MFVQQILFLSAESFAYSSSSSSSSSETHKLVLFSAGWDCNDLEHFLKLQSLLKMLVKVKKLMNLLVFLARKVIPHISIDKML